MMIKQIFISVLFLLIAENNFAQTTIKGRIIDQNREAISFANVLILNPEDSSLIQGAVSTNDGSFELSHPSAQTALLSLRFVGYNDYYALLSPNNGITDLGEMVLSENVQAIDEVVVKHKTTLYEQKIDRTIVNLQNSPTNAGNTALNVLGKSPGVSVSRATGEIALLGKQGVLVMINNKEVRMESSDLVNLLDAMPAANIKNIELITTPPANYDAQGFGGIININMIDNKNEGFNGKASANTGYGKNPMYGTTVNLNYSKNKFSVNGNLAANVDYGDQDVELQTDYIYPTDHVISTMQSNRDVVMGLYSADAAMAYQLLPKTEIGTMFNFYNRDWVMDADANSSFIKKNGNSTQLVKSHEVNNFYRMLYNANIRHSFTNDIKLTVDYDYIYFNRSNPTNYSILDNGGTAIEKRDSSISDASTPLDIYVLKADFTMKASENVKFETGLKMSSSAFTNSVRVAENVNNEYINNPDFTQKYNLSDDNIAAYVSAEWQISSRAMARGGLRYENYNIKLDGEKSGNILNSRKGDIFPSISVNFKINEHQELTTSFAKRINRPGFMQLAPYFYFFNRSSLFTGNPNLVPSNSFQYRVQYRYHKFNASLEYTQIEKPILNWQPAIDTIRNLAIFGPSQGKEASIYSLSLSLPWAITSRWNCNFNTILSIRDQSPIIMGATVKNITKGADLSMNQSYELAKGLYLELTYFYNTRFYEGAALIAARNGLDMGIQYRFKNNAALSFNVNDIFDTGSEWPISAAIAEHQLQYRWKYNYEGRVFRLSFSFPFGNKNLKQLENRESGSSEEQQRL